ncbi:MAG: bifunctional folylpolyglutamate synthase/dihydrofolate synthase [Ruminococcaceae bacterium]|nr:bifunctional folylpolyglutamate synthase/dihydrofolate synthase [Oscillospiraceae bacterium]
MDSESILNKKSAPNENSALNNKVISNYDSDIICKPILDYEAALNFISGRAIFGSRPGFERINALLDRLDHPEKGLKYIHIAGTNGKGSVCNTVANILTKAGYKTGLFISPFVSNFRERMQINGEYIEKTSLVTHTETVRKVVKEISKLNIEPTEFEIITAIMFLYFKAEKCDVVVLEVGLGGLLDSTNVIDTPLCSAIVSISFDHMSVLGNTIEEIAVQKAGIIKSNGVTICAPNQPENALHVIRTACFERKNKLIIADPSEIDLISDSILGNTISFDSITATLPLIGKHQIDNFSVSREIIKVLISKGFEISNDAIKAGIETTTVPARVEVLSTNPLVILDGGHNVDGAKALKNALCKYIADKTKTLVIGVMADKEVDLVLSILAPLAKNIITTLPNSNRSMKAEELAKAAKKYCKNVESIKNPTDAFDKALKIKNDSIIICGSLYLAGDVRQHALKRLNN